MSRINEAPRGSDTGGASGDDVQATELNRTCISKPDKDCKRGLLLEISAYENDGGERVGKRPYDVPLEILSLLFGAKNPLKAIRARCLDCCCDQPSEVRKCVSLDCPSWPFRMGKNPFRKRRTLTSEQKRKAAERLGRGAA